MLRYIVALMLAVAVLLPQTATAQDQAPASTPLVAEQQKALDTLTRMADGFEKQISLEGEDDAKLVEIRLGLEDISREALQSALAFRPRLAEINARLEQLGPAPADGQAPEPDIVTTERGQLAAEKAQINGVLAAAQNLSLRSNGMIDKIALMRSELFRSLLSKRYQLTDALSGEVISDANQEFR
ncbi:MAG: mechanosensitive ion channel family protein, partial [Mesorhizobium sp.]|nr:mechanosensitive ion channel family protein [Mesorhizobium sp.]